MNAFAKVVSAIVSQEGATAERFQVFHFIFGHLSSLACTINSGRGSLLDTMLRSSNPERVAGRKDGTWNRAKSFSSLIQRSVDVYHFA